MISIKKKASIIFIGIYLFCVVGLLVMHGQMKLNERKEIVAYGHCGEKSDQTEQEIYIDVNISKKWKESHGGIGAQFDGVFYNNSNKDVTDWEIIIQLPERSRIDSLWNGVYEHIGDEVIIKPVDYNYVIEKNSSDTFGYVLHTYGVMDDKLITLKTHKKYLLRDEPIAKVIIMIVIITTLVLIFYVIFEIRLKTYKKKEAADKKMIQQSLNTFAKFIDVKDSYTKGHSTRVAHYSKEIGRCMKFDAKELEKLYQIALLHDIGKVGVRNEILNKPGQLTDEEWDAIKQHTVIGEDILKEFTALPGIAEGAHYHHERYDGKGYPKGLKGLDIPLYARIICVADAYDAMSSNRCYRDALSEEEILRELTEGAGSQFDPEIVPIMISLITEETLGNLNVEKTEDYDLSAELL